MRCIQVLKTREGIIETFVFYFLTEVNLTTKFIFENYKIICKVFYDLLEENLDKTLYRFLSQLLYYKLIERI